MARFVLAILVVAALVIAALVALRAMQPGGTAGPAGDSSPLKQLSYALLLGLIGYVAIAGGD